ncbi:hypothetical protein [Lactococcus kimchii]|uniref:hypothetical protein n=1 Tax=Lactococcus sp. S-13 TaxID=2507158 RepID=UPI001023CBFC|nr:hypothetical protein [Lactococcus sp. S-13]RZI49119.1 hypothetical protein EQJ87_06525 [Lactococcus sp. S-13]
MKKIIIGSLTLLAAVSLSACSSNNTKSNTFSKESDKAKQALFLKVPSSVVMDSRGVALIRVKTIPNGKVRIGESLTVDSQSADSEGNFTLKLASDPHQKSAVKVTAGILGTDGKEIAKQVTKDVNIKPSE